jgi:precorrin-6Y C5,15-methyltransferase (decarboxylating)
MIMNEHRHRRRTAAVPVDDVLLTVVGIVADGWVGLPQAVRSLVLDAEFILGAPRQLCLIPAVPGWQRVTWPTPLRAGLS